MENTALTTIQNNRSALAAFEEEAAEAVAGSKAFLKFTKQAEWLWGKEDREVGQDEEIALNMLSYAKGFICWVDGEPAAERMEFLASGKPVQKSDLEDFGPYESSEDGWKLQVAVDLKLLSDGTELHYATTSKGGRSALGEVLKEFATRAKLGEPDLIPIVRLSSDSYKHKKYGRIATPAVEVVCWTNLAALESKEEAPTLFEKEPVEKEPARKGIRKHASSRAGDGRQQRLAS